MYSTKCSWIVNTELISQKIPEFASREVTDKGLLWEMIKMEIRAATILFSKRKARQKRDEEKKLLEEFNRLQEQIRANFKGQMNQISEFFVCQSNVLIEG